MSAALTVPDQPTAERVLRHALARQHPPQQLLLFGPPGTGKGAVALQIAWALMDPDDEHRRTDEVLDLNELRATGANILLPDIEEALRQLAARPSVMRRRVLIIHDAERLREQEGAPRILKTLEEPPPRAHILLVTDRPADLLPTIRSRCLPVPFRAPGWRAVARRLEERGLPADEAAARARARGAAALGETAFEAEMGTVGVELGLAALGAGATAASPGRQAGAIQASMEAIAARNPSDELVRLRAEAEALGTKRGGRTAQKRADDQEKRERRRLVSDGWALVLDAAAGLVADALAVCLGADGAVRHTGRVDELRALVAGTPQEVLERTVAEFQRARAELELNPTNDLAAEALLVRIASARAGRPFPLEVPGRLPW